MHLFSPWYPAHFASGASNGMNTCYPAMVLASHPRARPRGAVRYFGTFATAGFGFKVF